MSVQELRQFLSVGDRCYLKEADDRPPGASLNDSVNKQIISKRIIVMYY